MELPHDMIYLKLPNGREVIGRALKVNESIHMDGGPGVVNARFDIDQGIPPMEICAVLMMVDIATTTRIFR